MADFSRLPEECILHVLSRTSPEDVCRAAMVCPVFRSAADFDFLWEKFLPSDVDDILSRAVDRIEYSSKKELYFNLCDPILIDDGKMSFCLEKSSGRKCYMLSPKLLRLEGFEWISLRDSRFANVAELVDGPWLEIYGTLESKILSRETMYGVHLVFSIVERSRGLDRFHKATVKLGGNVSHRVGRFRGRKRKQPSSNGNLAAVDVMEPHRRPDGWMEIEIGEFYTSDGDDGEVKMCVVDNNARHISGLIVHGVDIRPKC
ncbi:Phloem protein 2-like protein [Dioscorea alata]|uniref:Phloem protein 2-like protein n=1 Tax=Dioscorea alata TaxID=55571 RepID=A0ACB7V879_DIOAL|nr:Phloem protein 2-like protein [Dioscorea alata]